MPIPASLERAHSRVQLLRLLKDGPKDTGFLAQATYNVQTSTSELLRRLLKDGFVIQHASTNSKKPDTWELAQPGIDAVS